MVRDDALDLARDVVSADRVDVQAIEQRVAPARRRPVRDRSIGSGRRRTPSSSGLPRSWQTAPSMTVTAAGGRDRRFGGAPGRRPAACAPRRRPPGATRVPAGSRRALRAPETAARSTPSSSASAKPDRRPLGQEQQLLDFAPDAFGGQIVERDAAGRSSFVSGSISRSKRAANCMPRSTRRLSSPNVARIDGAQHAALEQIAPAVERIDVDVGQRIPGDRVDREVAPPRRFLGRHARIAA